MVLNHTSGFPNWRFFRSDRKLAFENGPGATYGYSGEGFEYLARAVERKLRQPFPRLVATYVFDPIGMTASTLEIRREGLTNLARPVDERDVFPGYYCRPNGGCREEGSYSAADDMIITVRDYARFLISVMSEQGYDSKLAEDSKAEPETTGGFSIRTTVWDTSQHWSDAERLGTSRWGDAAPFELRAQDSRC